MCVHDWVERQAACTPDALAIVSDSTQLTYRELTQRANQLAHYLQRLGVKPDERVAIHAERGPELLIAVLAVLKAGGAYVPLDVSYPAERLEYMLEDAQPQVLLSTAELLQRSPGMAARAGGCTVLDLEQVNELLAQELPQPPVSGVGAQHLIYCLYTSGSTGQPKGVAMEHAALSNLIAWHLRTYRAAAKMLQYSPLSFDISCHEIFATWCSGGTLYLVSEATRRNPVSLLEYIVAQGIEKIYLPFTPLQQLAEAVEYRGMLPSSLREVMTAGEQLRITPALTRLFARLDATLYNHYGMTECQDVSTYTLSPKVYEWENLPPVGRPITHIQLHVLDEAGVAVAAGGTGELHIGGVGLARGYLHRPALTQQKFIIHPHFGRLYRSGDLAQYTADGNLNILGRMDQMVKIRGFRVEIGEVEAVLDRHPAVRQAVVVAQENQDKTCYLAAYLLTVDATEIPLAELRQFVGDRLPGYMVPSSFMFMTAFPMTPSGKVDRKALQAKAGKEVHAVEQTLRTRLLLQPNIAIRNDMLQAYLRNEIIQLGGVSAEAGQNFFDLGLDSMLLIELTYRLIQQLGVELPAAVVFHYADLASLAAYLSENLNSLPILPALSSERISVSHPWMPQLHIQQESYIWQENLANKTALHNYLCFCLRNLDHPERLKQIFEWLVARHEALRTVFVRQGSALLQRILPSLPFDFSLFDCANLDDAAIEVQILASVNKPFDLEHEAPLRCHLFQRRPDETFMLIVAHQIASDGVALAILLEELWESHAALSQGHQLDLPPLEASWHDYLLWQGDMLQGETGERLWRYWQQQLAAPLPLFNIPTDFPRPPVNLHRGSFQSFEIGAELTDKLRALARAERCSLTSLLLAVYNLGLHLFSQQTDILVANFILNRTQPRFARLVGRFVDDVVFRTRIDPAARFQQLLRQVHDTLLEAIEHQNYPYKLIAEKLQQSEDLTYRALCQASFLVVPQAMFQASGALFSPECKETLNLGGLLIENTHIVPNEAAHWHDIDSYFVEGVETLYGTLSYNTDLFKDASIVQLVNYIQQILRYVVEQPNIQMSELRDYICHS